MMMTSSKPVPVATGLSKPYWDSVHRGELSSMWCALCDSWVFPPREGCRQCGPAGIEWRTPAQVGEVLSFTVVHQAVHEAFQDECPYIVAVVRLDGGPRILANIIDPDEMTRISVGQRVRLVFEHRGSDVVVPQFSLLSNPLPGSLYE